MYQQRMARSVLSIYYGPSMDLRTILFEMTFQEVPKSPSMFFTVWVLYVVGHLDISDKYLSGE